MRKEIDLKIQSGPCIGCGEMDYPLSMGGPAICPACDCGQDLKIRLGPYREQIKQLQAEVEEKQRHINRTIDHNDNYRKAIARLQAEVERLRDWLGIIQEDAETICCLAEKTTAENIHRLIVKQAEQVLKKEE